MLRSKEKSVYSFAVDFAMGGASAAVCKTAAGPIERVRLLIQNQVCANTSARSLVMRGCKKTIIPWLS